MTTVGSDWLEKATPDEFLQMVTGMIPMPGHEDPPEGTRNWAEWDLLHGGGHTPGTAKLTGVQRTEGVCEHCGRELGRVFSVKYPKGTTAEVGRKCASKATGYKATMVQREADRVKWVKNRDAKRKTTIQRLRDEGHGDLIDHLESAPQSMPIGGGQNYATNEHMTWASLADGAITPERAREMVNLPATGTRNWAKWDAEHPWEHIERASMGKAEKHISKAAKRFYAKGGTIERIEIRTPERLHALQAELGQLKDHLKDHAIERGGSGTAEELLGTRTVDGFLMANLALSDGTRTIHVARTKEGHIAAVSAHSESSPHYIRPVTYISHMGSTGITHGAGSVITQAIMREAAARNHPVTLEPWQQAAEHWRGNLGAHEGAVLRQPDKHLGWTPEEVKRLAAA